MNHLVEIFAFLVIDSLKSFSLEIYAWALHKAKIRVNFKFVVGEKVTLGMAFIGPR